MNKIIVTGHGHFATGLQSTLELLAGKNDDVFFIDFVEGDSDSLLKTKFESVLSNNIYDNFIFFCDLAGGTPYKVAATLAFENDRVEVVAGCNVGSLIEMLFTKESYSISELANKFITVSKDAMELFEKKIQSEKEENGFFEDGI